MITDAELEEVNRKRRRKGKRPLTKSEVSSYYRNSSSRRNGDSPSGPVDFGFDTPTRSVIGPSYAGQDSGPSSDGGAARPSSSSEIGSDAGASSGGSIGSSISDSGGGGFDSGSSSGGGGDF